MDRLRQLSLSQGYFTRPDALAAGYDDQAIRRALRSKAWRRLRVGTYCHADVWPDSEQRRLLLRGRSVAAKLGDSVALSHVSSALEHGLLLHEPDLSLVHTTRLDGGAGRTEAGVRHHEGLLLPSDLVRVGGVLTTRPARAALETAALADAAAGLVTLDSVLHQEKATVDELRATYRLMQSWPGMQRVDVTVRMADGGSESVGETLARYLCFMQGIPAPTTQFEVRDRTGRLVATTDLAWREHRLLGEFDGKVKYGRLLRDGESPADAVFREKRREDAIRETLPDWRMIRLVWADLYDARRTAARIWRMLHLAA